MKRRLFGGVLVAVALVGLFGWVSGEVVSGYCLRAWYDPMCWIF